MSSDHRPSNLEAAGAILFGLLALGILAGPGWFQPAMSAQPAMLQGSVRKTVSADADTHNGNYGPNSDEATGIVRDEGGQPLSGVRVSIPGLGYQTTSGADGRFSLPSVPEQPVIAAFARSGYTPQTATLDTARLNRAPLQLTLHALHNTLVVDSEIRHLGDNSFSSVSAGAADFRRGTIGPVLIRHFTLSAQGPEQGDTSSTLEIGSVIGLDTQAAHQRGQSIFHRTSSPMSIRLNGRLIGRVAVNGDRQKLVIPPGTLVAGENTLRIETGFETHDGEYIDYDDMELMLITLNF